MIEGQALNLKLFYLKCILRATKDATGDVSALGLGHYQRRSKKSVETIKRKYIFSAQFFIFQSELFDEMASFIGWNPERIRINMKRIIERTGGEPKRLFIRTIQGQNYADN